ncbi:MAG: hypothetical protein ACRDJ9_34855, partial [Dehalococcoidia bacterium]
MPKSRWWPIKPANRARLPERTQPAAPVVPGSWLEQFDPEAWAALTQLWKQPLTDVDRARIAQALDLAEANAALAPRIAGELLRRRELAALHRSGQRDL